MPDVPRCRIRHGGSDVLTIAVSGEALVDFIEGEDGAYRPHLGGSPYNVVIGLARQGIDVTYLSPLAQDAFGDQLADTLLREGVHLPMVRRSPRPTSLALVSIDASGSPKYELYREGIADKDTSFEEICAHLPDSCKLFHTGSLAITPSQLPKNRQLFEHLTASNILISVDINIRLGASLDTTAYLDGVMSLVEYCDIVKASDEDLLALGLCDDVLETAELVYDKITDGLLVLTEGQGGAQVFSPSGLTKRAAYPVAQLRDTIGAGDTFHAAFLANLSRLGLLDKGLSQLDLPTLGNALDYACAAATINISRVGCSPPTHVEVQRFVQAANLR